MHFLMLYCDIPWGISANHAMIANRARGQQVYVYGILNLPGSVHSLLQMGRLRNVERHMSSWIFMRMVYKALQGLVPYLVKGRGSTKD